MTGMVKKILISLGIIFLLFCTFILLVRIGVLEIETPESGTKIYSIDADELKTIDISNENGNYTLIIDGENAYLRGYENRRYDQKEIGGVIETCRKIYAYDVIEKDSANLSVYGLDKPEKSLTASNGTDVYTIYVGDMMPNNNSYYVSLNSGTTVYAVNEAYLYYCKLDYTDYLSKNLSLLKTQDTEYMIDNFSLTQKGSPIFEFHAYTDEEKAFNNSSNLYTITYPYNAVGKDANIVKYLNTITNLLCARINSTNVNDEVLEQYGLTDPEYIIKYTYYDTPFTIRISKPEGGVSNLYVEGDDTCYAFLAQKLYLLNFDIFNLVNSNQFSREITYVERVLIEYNNTSNVYGLNWSGTTLADVTFNGGKVNPELFKNFYTLLVSSRIDATSTEDIALDNPYFSFTFKYNNSSGFNPDTVSFYPANSRQYVMTINGQGEFYVSSVYVDKLVDSHNSLNKGESFTATW